MYTICKPYVTENTLLHIYIYNKKHLIPKNFTTWISTMSARTDLHSTYKRVCITLLHAARKYTYAAFTAGTFTTHCILHYTICKILKIRTPTPKILYTRINSPIHNTNKFPQIIRPKPQQLWLYHIAYILNMLCIYIFLCRNVFCIVKTSYW
jgi:hypothetical protein